jgi:alpha-L-rhamnosidase
MSRIAGILGMDEERAKYDALFRSIRKTFQREYVTSGAHVKGETQTGYLLALSMDLLPENQRSDAASLLVKDIERKGWRLSTGFLGVRYLCPVLTEMGYPEVAYRLLLQDEFPSWGYSIRHGATSIWERWNGWTADKGFFNPGMN